MNGELPPGIPLFPPPSRPQALGIQCPWHGRKAPHPPGAPECKLRAAGDLKPTVMLAELVDWLAWSVGLAVWQSVQNQETEEEGNPS